MIPGWTEALQLMEEGAKWQQREGGAKEMKTNLDGSLPSFSWLPLIDIEGIITRGYNPDALKGAAEKRENLKICLNSIRKGYHLT